MKRKAMILVLIMLSTFLLMSCKKGNKNISSYFEDGIPDINQLKPPALGEEIAIIKTTKGNMKMRLFEDVAPLAVENFRSLVKEGYYDGYEFSRIEENFVIQVRGNLRYPHGKSIYGDFYDTETNLRYHNFLGAVGMGKDGGNKNSSLFYITSRRDLLDEDIDFLERNHTNLNDDEVYAYKTIGGVPRFDNNYTVFGQVYEGINILIDISKTTINQTTNEILEKVFINEIIFEKVQK